MTKVKSTLREKNGRMKIVNGWYLANITYCDGNCRLTFHPQNKPPFNHNNPSVNWDKRECFFGDTYEKALEQAKRQLLIVGG